MWVLGGLCDVAFNAAKFGQLARGYFTGGSWSICCAVFLESQINLLIGRYVQHTPIVGPVCAGVSPGNTLCSAPSCCAERCSAGFSTGCSCASLSGARVAISLSAMMLLCDCGVHVCVEGSNGWLTYACKWV